MKLSEVIEKYGDCEVNGKLVEMLKPKGDWIPKMNDTYWKINICGEVVYGLWEDCYFDYFALNKRNVYRTKEEAQFALDMYNFCKERSFEPDWDDMDQFKYNLYLNYKNKIKDYSCNVSANIFEPFTYPTVEAVEEIINKYSFEDLEKYYGRV